MRLIELQHCSSYPLASPASGNCFSQRSNVIHIIHRARDVDAADCLLESNSSLTKNVFRRLKTPERVVRTFFEGTRKGSLTRTREDDLRFGHHRTNQLLVEVNN